MGGMFCAQQSFAQAEEEANVATNSTEFKATLDKSVDELIHGNFAIGLRSPGLGSLSNDDINRIVPAIRREWPVPGVVTRVDSSLTSGEFDVVLQPGHNLRVTGKTGATGHRVSERALVAYIAGPIADDLSRRGLRVLVIPADPIIEGTLKAKIFLAIHADGSTVPCKGKPSLGYGSNTSPMAMHAIGWALGQALGYSYDDFAHDNFTANESKYYMFNRVQTKLMKGVLEIGEITCNDKEDRLIQNSADISANVARALTFIAGK
jgi:hypothetical protein